MFLTSALRLYHRSHILYSAFRRQSSWQQILLHLLLSVDLSSHLLVRSVQLSSYTDQNSQRMDAPNWTAVLLLMTGHLFLLTELFLSVTAYIIVPLCGVSYVIIKRIYVIYEISRGLDAFSLSLPHSDARFHRSAVGPCFCTPQSL